MHVCQCKLIYMLFKTHTGNEKHWTIYGELVHVLFNNASYRSHELPRHEKICLRGLRPGRRDKTGCTAKEANWRLEFVIKERTSNFDFAFAQ